MFFQRIDGGNEVSIEHRITKLEEAAQEANPRKPVKSFLLIPAGKDAEEAIAEFKKENGAAPKVILSSPWPGPQDSENEIKRIRPSRGDHEVKKFKIGKGYINDEEVVN
jgi:hypothetical protein